MVTESCCDFSLQPARTPGQPQTGAAPLLSAHFRLTHDISGLFPSSNLLAEAAGYFPTLPFIRFVLDRCCCGLHPTHGVAASFAREVLRLVANGAPNPEIAVSLKISSHTVKSHLIAIFNKLALNHRTQPAVWAARHNLIC